MADTATANGSLVTGEDPQNSEELSVFVQNLLSQMQSRFQTMSNAIIGRIDEMGNRIDDLEKSVSDLMTQAGVDESTVRSQE